MHKLITVATPHTGSYFATALLKDSCMANYRSEPPRIPFMPQDHHLVFGKTVTLTQLGAPIATGGTWDLTGGRDQLLNSASSAIQDLHNNAIHSTPTHVMVGVTDDTNFGGPLDGFAFKFANCSGEIVSALRDKKSGLDNFFNDSNDGVVGRISQYGGISPVNSTDEFKGVLHAQGMIRLFLFSGMSEVYKGVPTAHSPIKKRIIELLNYPLVGRSEFTPYPN
jgi:hypothetical protein